MSNETETHLHASCVAFGAHAVLIIGKSGSGKSSLALGLIALGAVLVSDDQVLVTGEGAEMTLSSPPNLQGLIEARGIGIIPVSFVKDARLKLVVDLDDTSDQRLPPIRNTVINSARFPLIAGKNVPNLNYAIAAWLGANEVLDLVDPDEWQPWNDEN